MPRMRNALAGVLALAFALRPALAGEADTRQVEARPKAVLTGKERLGGKASDEQRVDNCKVPPRLRGSKHRPDACGPDVTEPATQ